MLAGAGQILGLDGRYEDANNHGLGGLLDSSTWLGCLVISQAQAIWPFDSSGSSSSLDSSPSETGSSGGTFPFDLFGSGSSLTQSSSAQASSTKSTSDSASSTDSSLFSSSNSGSSWYQTF